MKIGRYLAASAALAFSVTASAGPLDDVRKKGHVDCGISTGVAGFAFTDDKGNWQGFDPAVCKAVAAAVFGDSTSFVRPRQKSQAIIESYESMRNLG